MASNWGSRIENRISTVQLMSGGGGADYTSFLQTKQNTRPAEILEILNNQAGLTPYNYAYV